MHEKRHNKIAKALWRISALWLIVDMIYLVWITKYMENPTFDIILVIIPAVMGAMGLLMYDPYTV